jgi:hypothetical protein
MQESDKVSKHVNGHITRLKMFPEIAMNVFKSKIDSIYIVWGPALYFTMIYPH